MKIILGGFILEEGSFRRQIPMAVDPDGLAVKKALTSLADGAGVLKMRSDPMPEIGPYELVLYAEYGKFFLMLNETDFEGDTNPRTLKDNTIKNELVDILGEKFPAKAITHNIELVCSVFNEFANTGAVSRSLLN